MKPINNLIIKSTFNGCSNKMYCTFYCPRMLIFWLELLLLPIYYSVSVILLNTINLVVLIIHITFPLIIVLSFVVF